MRRGGCTSTLDLLYASVGQGVRDRPIPWHRRPCVPTKSAVIPLLSVDTGSWRGSGCWPGSCTGASSSDGQAALGPAHRRAPRRGVPPPGILHSCRYSLPSLSWTLYSTVQ